MIFEANDTVLFIGNSITDYQRKRPCGEGLSTALAQDTLRIPHRF